MIMYMHDTLGDMTEGDVIMQPGGITFSKWVNPALLSGAKPVKSCTTCRHPNAVRWIWCRPLVWNCFNHSWESILSGVFLHYIFDIFSQVSTNTQVFFSTQLLLLTEELVLYLRFVFNIFSCITFHTFQNNYIKVRLKIFVNPACP